MRNVRALTWTATRLLLTYILYYLFTCGLPGEAAPCSGVMRVHGLINFTGSCSGFGRCHLPISWRRREKRPLHVKWGPRAGGHSGHRSRQRHSDPITTRAKKEREQDEQESQRSEGSGGFVFWTVLVGLKDVGWVDVCKLSESLWGLFHCQNRRSTLVAANCLYTVYIPCLYKWNQAIKSVQS